MAAYCRVSTDHEEQESSYEAQCTHYRDFIAGHPEWELAGIYADEGISGLAAHKRPEFKRLIEDCMDGRVQMVITKSISRFARNTLDCLQYLRKLKARSIPILFEKENILTTDAKGEILITIRDRKECFFAETLLLVPLLTGSIPVSALKAPCPAVLTRQDDGQKTECKST